MRISFGVDDRLGCQDLSPGGLLAGNQMSPEARLFRMDSVPWSKQSRGDNFKDWTTDSSFEFLKVILVHNSR